MRGSGDSSPSSPERVETGKVTRSLRPSRVLRRVAVTESADSGETGRLQEGQVASEERAISNFR